MTNDGPGFEKFEPFEADVAPRRDVYRCGEGRPVVILHELTGATPALFRFGWRVAAAGFSVYVPIFFGTPNQDGNALSKALSFARVCVSKEFDVFRQGRSSPITDWIRALARLLQQHHGVDGVGVIGLCLTGNFALAAALDASVLAPVASEPALPFGLTASAKRDLKLSADEIASLKQRVHDGLQILAFRFDGDRFSPAERYANLQQTFGPAVLGDGRLSPTRKCAHSVFTSDFDASQGSSTASALTQLLAFLAKKL